MFHVTTLANCPIVPERNEPVTDFLRSSARIYREQCQIDMSRQENFMHRRRILIFRFAFIADVGEQLSDHESRWSTVDGGARREITTNMSMLNLALSVFRWISM